MTPNKMKIWAQAYRPFIMGGDVNSNISINADWDIIVELREVGKPTITLYRIIAPDGRIYYAEGSTSGLMGSNLNDLAIDYHHADAEVLRKQLNDNATQLEKSDSIEPKKFWELVR